MTETEQRYDLKSIIDNIKEYYENGTFTENKSHQLEVITTSPEDSAFVRELAE